MKITRILSVLLCLCLLTGCADLFVGNSRIPEQASGQTVKNIIEGSAADIDYEVPESVPKILINQVGYKPASDKVAVFRGENLPSVFHVIHAETGKTVYTGHIEESKYNEELDEYNSFGVFSELTESGIYYIMADVIGMSYPFAIKEDIYEDIFYDAFRQYADYIEKPETYVMCEELAVLLLSFELYGNTYTDDMNIPESGNGIPDILDLMKKTTEQLFYRYHEQTGGVSAGSDMAEENAEASLYFAAVMSKFYHTYKIYDGGYADTCLRAARKAFEYAQTSFDRLDGGIVYFAAAELYRATGAAKYAAVLDAYCMAESRTETTGTSKYFFGDVTYLSTTFRVDTKVCERLMNALRERVEKIAGDSKAEEYLTCGTKAQDNNEELLADMMELSVVNYIIANHEYDTVLQNHLHYFLGRNTKCISYVENAGYVYCAKEESLLNDAVQNAQFIAMLSAIR